MAEHLLAYERLIEDALRGVMREALARVAAHGLPDGHHFYITFRTGHAGVALAESLRAQYPDQMTIVLQHQFWDLEVGEAEFSVRLSFGATAQRLAVPFAAVTQFADPDAKFALQFQPPASAGAAPAAAPAEPAPEPAAGGGDKVVSLDRFKRG